MKSPSRLSEPFCSSNTYDLCSRPLRLVDEIMCLVPRQAGSYMMHSYVYIPYGEECLIAPGNGRRTSQITILAMPHGLHAGSHHTQARISYLFKSKISPFLKPIFLDPRRMTVFFSLHQSGFIPQISFT